MTADLRTLILEAIDRLQAGVKVVTAWTIAADARIDFRINEVAAELRAMAKAGIVVYDRKAAGWRRA
jgi:hypothetical protein